MFKYCPLIQGECRPDCIAYEESGEVIDWAMLKIDSTVYHTKQTPPRCKHYDVDM